MLTRAIMIGFKGPYNFKLCKTITMSSLLFLLIGFAATIAESKKSSKIPDDITLCKKDDPALNKCLEDLFEKLRPRLIQGMPEIDVPPLDPFYLPELVVFKGGKGQMRAIGKDIKITGIGNYKIHYIKANIDKLEVAVSITFPWLQYEGTYDVDMNFMNIPLKGKGPMKGNATEIVSKAVLKGMLVDKDGEKHVEFTSADVDITLKDYHIRVDKLFSDKQLNDALNLLMNDRKVQSIQTAKPIVNQVASRMILEMVNNISKNFAFDEVFA